jgi:hypothetical protein
MSFKAKIASFFLWAAIIIGVSAPARAQADRQTQAKRLKDDIARVNMTLLSDDKCALFTPLTRIAAQAKTEELRHIAARAGFSDVDKFEASIATFVDGQTCAALSKNGFVKSGKAYLERITNLQVASWQYYFKYFKLDHSGEQKCNFQWSYSDLKGAAQKNKSLANAVSGLPEAKKKQLAQQVKSICESERSELDARPVMRKVMDAMINAIYHPTNGVKFGEMLKAYRGDGASIEFAQIKIPWAVEGLTRVDILGNGSAITDGTMLGHGNTQKTVRFGFAQNKQFFMIIDSGVSNTTFGADILDARIGTNVPDHSWILNTPTKEFTSADVPQRFPYVVYAMSVDQSAALMKAILAGEDLNLAFTRKLFGTETVTVQNLDTENLKKAVLYAFAPKISF